MVIAEKRFRIASPRRCINVIPKYPVHFVTMSDSLDELQRAEEVALIQRVGARDEKAFAELYDRFSPRLYGLALRMVRNAKDAEDVLQESFRQIWKRAETYDSNLSSAFSWAMMIVWHKSMDRLRSRHRVERIADSAAAFHHFAEADETSALQPLVTERRLEVRQALAKIPDDQREALSLAFFSGLTHQQISEHLGVPLGTIKARIRRGLQRLHDLLGRDA
jgi:RNA polymerase sigma-70 factor (ECF subfamily)